MTLLKVEEVSEQKPDSCQTCIYWTVDTPEQSKAANDPLNWWGSCSQLKLQTEADFCCQFFFRNLKDLDIG